MSKPHTLEYPFMKHLMIALGRRKDMKIWRQNTGGVEVYKNGGSAGWFHAGPPDGAADISGIVSPEGCRLEIETKGEDTVTREAQDAWCAMIRRCGGVYVRVRYDEANTMPENVADAVRAIESEVSLWRSKLSLLCL